MMARAPKKLTALLASSLAGACATESPGTNAGATPTTSIAAYTQALAAVRKAGPASAVAAATAHCLPIDDEDLRADCLLAAAGEAAPVDAKGAETLCSHIPHGVIQDECHFVLAEGSGQVETCVRAGRFAQDCRMHAWSRTLQAASTQWQSIDDVIETVRTSAPPELGALDPHLPAFRLWLGAQDLLDLAPCATLTDAELEKACTFSGLGLFHDRMNHARDTGAISCPNPAESPSLAHRPHPQLSAALTQRQDLCP